MGFLRNMFSGNKTFSNIIINTQSRLFEIYGVSRPSDSQKMRASFYLCVSGMAFMNELGHGKLNEVIDMLVDEAKALTSPLSMQVGELTDNRLFLNRLLGILPEGAIASTQVNGLVAFEALYSLKGEQLVNAVLSGSKGPLGTTGSATIVVADGIFGDGKSKEHFMEVAAQVLDFFKSLHKAVPNRYKRSVLDAMQP